jgi:hypothetical protein
VSARQFIACVFKSGGRSYTYHNDGEPVAEGDQVKVTPRDGDGFQVVTVVAVVDQAPSFPTKGILGKAAPKPPETLL